MRESDQSPFIPSDPPAPLRTDREAVEPRIEAELTRLLYRSAGFGLFCNYVFAFLLAVAAWGELSDRLILVWFAALLVLSTARFGLNAAFAARPRDNHELPRWRRWFFIGMALAGLIWGLGGWFFLEAEGLLSRSLVVFILAGLNPTSATGDIQRRKSLIHRATMPKVGTTWLR